MGDALVTDDGLNWLSNQMNPEWATVPQALAMSAYHEAAQGLIEYQRELDEIRAEVEAAEQPIPEALHLRFYRHMRDLYGSYYDAMERLMKVAVLYKRAFPGNEPAHRSVEAFIDWLERAGFATPKRAWMLREAREFRTRLTHSGDLPAHNWATFQIEITGQPVRMLRLFGHGPVPAHGTAHEPHQGHDNTWDVLSPVDSAVIRAFVVTVHRMFSAIIRYQMINEGRLPQ